MPVCIIIKEEPSLLTLNIDRSTTQGSHQQITEFFQSDHAHKSNVTSMAIRKAEPETTVARIGGSVNWSRRYFHTMLSFDTLSYLTSRPLRDLSEITTRVSSDRSWLAIKILTCTPNSDMHSKFWHAERARWQLFPLTRNINTMHSTINNRNHHS
jgi:hypothetical protein